MTLSVGVIPGGGRGRGCRRAFAHFRLTLMYNMSIFIQIDELLWGKLDSCGTRPRIRPQKETRRKLAPPFSPPPPLPPI